MPKIMARVASSCSTSQCIIRLATLTFFMPKRSRAAINPSRAAALTSTRRITLLSIAYTIIYGSPAAQGIAVTFSAEPSEKSLQVHME